MKVIFNCHVPFMLAHGGAQIQIEQTQAGLQKIGVEVEPLRWWDGTQTGDVLQHFGRIPFQLLLFARQKGLKVVITDLLTETGSRSKPRLRVQKLVTQMIQTFAPRSVTAAFNWESYRQADACIANTPWEAHLMTFLYGAPPERVHVLPNGVEDVFFQNSSGERGTWLVCTATITQRKRVLELAEGAVAAQTPLRVIGKPYAPDDPYAKRFFELVKNHSSILRYEGPIADRKELARAYHEARGFVLLSAMETRSLSSEEAAASGCPLLLSDLPWARDVFANHAVYCSVRNSVSETAAVLRKFYAAAPNLPATPPPASWTDVGRQLKGIYQSLLNPGVDQVCLSLAAAPPVGQSQIKPTRNLCRSNLNFKNIQKT